ncbi:MAG: hypothetical protein SGCHY_001331 [Lobulomycetales sp.]
MPNFRLEAQHMEGQGSPASAAKDIAAANVSAPSRSSPSRIRAQTLSRVSSSPAVSLLFRRRSTQGRVTKLASSLASSSSPAVDFLNSFNESVDGGDREEPQGFLPGDEIGHYTLVKQLGAGAFSEVWEAEATGLSEPHVAIKMIRKADLKEEAEQKSRSQFNMIDLADVDGVKEDAWSDDQVIQNETAIWSELKHPNIIEFYNVYNLQDHVIVISELASGGNLFEFLCEHPAGLSESEALSIFREILFAVHYMHQNHVIHRDIKCENILLCKRTSEYEHSADNSAGNIYSPDTSLSASMTNLNPYHHRTIITNSVPDLTSLGVVTSSNTIVNLSAAGSTPSMDRLARAGISRKPSDLISAIQEEKPSFDILDSPLVESPRHNLSAYTAKLADFGLSTSTSCPAPSDVPVGSLHYCAPEELDGHGGESSDVWSLACVLYAMVTGGLPFAEDFIPRLESCIRAGVYDEGRLEHCSDALRKLLQSMFEVDAKARAGIMDVMRSDWVLGTDSQPQSSGVSGSQK